MIIIIESKELNQLYNWTNDAGKNELNKVHHHCVAVIVAACEIIGNSIENSIRNDCSRIKYDVEEISNQRKSYVR